MKQYIIHFIIYFIVISIASIYITVTDKKAAVKHRWRVPENMLLLFGFLGGATAMLITMKKVRHKTKHMKFMIGLPLEIIFHIVITVWLFITLGW